ncbi:MAG: cupin domain-containing protein [Oscillibacter sp.]|nr:cupin domain-containing protein [Oscillibacter sp.]
MITRSEHCPVKSVCLREGKGEVQMKDLAPKEALYGHGRLFSHVTIQPGCSIGYHDHTHETEFYYIIRGEGLFNDDGQEIPVHTGDVCATGGGKSHSIENTSGEPLELIALIVLE